MQLGEAGFNDALRVRLFSLSLTGMAFSWFSSLAPNSIRNWAQLEYKFHENKEVYAAEFVWPSKAKPGSVPSFKPIQKNRQEELKFTFDVSKCD